MNSVNTFVLTFEFCLLTFDLFFAFVTPHPSRDGWKKRRRGPPSPLGRGPYLPLWPSLHFSPMLDSGMRIPYGKRLVL